MSSITPIGKQGINPEVIAHELMQDAAELSTLYVVAFHKDGRVLRYFSGTSAEMHLAGGIMQDSAINILRGFDP